MPQRKCPHYIAVAYSTAGPDGGMGGHLDAFVKTIEVRHGPCSKSAELQMGHVLRVSVPRALIPDLIADLARFLAESSEIVTVVASNQRGATEEKSPLKEGADKATDPLQL